MYKRALFLLMVFLVSCAVGTKGLHVSKTGRFNKYGWSGGDRYRWAIKADAYARKHFEQKELIRGSFGLVYCHPSDAPQYRIIVFRIKPGPKLFGGEPMHKFLYERGFTKVLFMSHGPMTYIDNYALSPDGMMMTEPVFKKFGTLLGPGKYQNNTGHADERMEGIGFPEQKQKQPTQGSTQVKSEVIDPAVGVSRDDDNHLVFDVGDEQSKRETLKAYQKQLGLPPLSPDPKK